MSIPTEHESNYSLIKDYIDAAKTASERTRIVLIVLVTTSVLSLFAAWNSSSFSWRKAKLNVATWEYTKCTQMAHAEGADATTPCEDKRAEISALSNAINDAETIHIPFFECSVDINDFGLFSGIAFTVVLGWFYTVLVDEHLQVKCIFREASLMDALTPEKPQDYLTLRRAYTLLYMHQVLHAPVIMPLLSPIDDARKDLSRLYSQNFISSTFYICLNKLITARMRAFFLQKTKDVLNLYYKHEYGADHDQYAARQMLSLLYSAGLCASPLLVYVTIAFHDGITLFGRSSIFFQFSCTTVSFEILLMPVIGIACYACFYEFLSIARLWYLTWIFINTQTLTRDKNPIDGD